MMRNRYGVIGLLLLLLSACGAPAATAPTAAPTPPQATSTVAPIAAAELLGAATQAPSAATEAAPTETPDISAAPTAAPAGGALLPAPLYFIQSQQIWRLERDGSTLQQLTSELLPIHGMDVAPDGGIAYLIGPEDDGLIVTDTLVYISPDGSQRSELFTGQIGSPQLSPPGDQIAFEIRQPLDGADIVKAPSDSGVWSIATSGGQPSLIQANDPISDPQDPPTDARLYFPHGWSPDGTQMLLGGYFPVGEGGLLAIKQLDSGKLLEVSDGCCEATWSTDGTAVVVAGGTQIQDAYLGLWRADAASGMAIRLLSAAGDERAALVTGARQLDDGQVYAFVKQMNDPPFDQAIPVTMMRVSSDGTTTALRQDSYPLADALWASDASGAVVAESNSAMSDPALLWLAADGSPAIRLPAKGMALRWGAPDSSPPAQTCPLAQPLVWQAPEQRGAIPEQQRVLVQALQMRLNQLGYSEVGVVDGIFGDATKQALINFQQASGLGTSGELDCATAQALMSSSAAHKS